MAFKEIRKENPGKIFRYAEEDVDEKWESLLKSTEVKLSHLGRYGYFDWKHHEKESYLSYFLLEDTELVKQLFRASALSKHKSIHLMYVGRGPNGSHALFEMDTEVFIENYEEFMCTAGGPLAIAESEKLFFEVGKYYLYSNFNVFGVESKVDTYNPIGFVV